MFSNIRIVLVETTHSGNLGSTARAMKTMGLNQLYLVAPQCAINDMAMALAAGAEDVLENAKIVSDLSTAIADCQYVLGTSVRQRHLHIHHLNARNAAQQVMSYANSPQIAFLFGRERIGLTNEELLKCHFHVGIETDAQYGSLNLAMAVQIITYELRMASQVQLNPKSPVVFEAAKQLEIEYFLTRTEQFYQQIGFIQNHNVMQKLRQLYLRAGLDNNELNILQGMLSSVQKKLIS